MINVLIADDQNSIRKTIESYLEPETDLNIVGFAKDGKTAIEQVESLKPDVVLMDIEMPVMDGLTATKTIAEKFVNTKVLILSVRDREQDVIEALKLGAKGYWLKNTSAKELSEAIRYVHKGYFQLASELVEKHFIKTIMLNSKAKNTLKTVDAVLDQIEEKFEFIEKLSPQSLNETVENVVEREMSLRKERDANLEFRCDRLKQQLNRVEKSANFTMKLQFIYNFILLAAIIALGYFSFFN